MKKLLVALFTLSLALVLTGCDLLPGGEGGDNNFNNLWYDQEDGSIVLSYDIPEPEADAETGEVLEVELHLEVKHEQEDEWTVITVLDSFKEDELRVPFNHDKFGNMQIRITLFEDGVETSNFGPWDIWIEEPMYLYHFNVWFDQWNGAVNVDYGLDYRNIDELELLKSNDGGLTWDSVMNIEIQEDKNYFTYYEFEEGNYVFKLKGYKDTELVEELTTYHEINVYFEKDRFTGTPEIWYAEASFDLWSKSVNIWWDSQGDYESIVVSKSTDQVNWEVVEEIPYYVKSLTYTEELEGIYFYKVELVGAANNPFIITNELRVRENAILNDINGWYDYNQDAININWDFFDEMVEVVTIERRVNDGEYELLGEFGDLKKMFTDYDLEVGTVMYRVSLFDSEGNLMDSLESPEFFVEAKQYLFNIWTWHNWDSEHIEIGVEFYGDSDNQLVLERSVNGGDYTVVEMNEDFYFKDPITEEGNYTYRVRVIDLEGNVLEEMFAEVYDVMFPSYIYHFDAWHDSQNGEIQFNFGLHTNVDHVAIHKSTDGGLTWTELLLEDIEINEDGYYEDHISYIETEEGEYVYKLVAFNMDGVLIDEYFTYYEIVVNYDHLNLDGEIEIYHIDASFNIYDNQVYIWYGTSGTYGYHIIERSTDGVNFELVATTSRYITSYSFSEDVEGEYYYRVTAINEAGEIADAQTTNYKVRVKFDALINYLYANYNWNYDVEVYFEFEGKDVAYLEVLRTDLDTNIIVSLGEFGSLKHVVKDEALDPGTYFYTVILYDTDGNILDQMDTNEVTVYE